MKKLALVLAMAMVLMTPINAYAATVAPQEADTKVARSTTVTSMSGELRGGGMSDKIFLMPTTAKARISFSSFAQESSAAAPISIYIDGFKVATSNGYGPGSITKDIQSGYRTLKVTNNTGLWIAYAVEITY